jgi:hypothetical protein
MQELPLDCDSRFDPDFLGEDEARNLFVELVSNYDVTNRFLPMADGTQWETETGVYLFADTELITGEVFPDVWGGRSAWPVTLAKVKERIESKLGASFQVARCVYYRDGSDRMAFHTDPPAYGPTDSIASLSLGAERDFVFRSLGDATDTYKLRLTSGSLLYMGENCQERYEHGVPPCMDCTLPRLNLTFRKHGWAA